MSNFKNETQKNFTIITNSILNDDRLTFELKGIYTYLISKPTGWNFSAEKISKQTSDSEGKIKRMLRDLESFGLLKRTKIKNGGKFMGIHYEMLSTISLKSTDGKTDDEKTDVGNLANISNTINSNTINSNTKEEVLSEIKISDDNPLLINFDDSEASQEAKITKALFDLIKHNQKLQGVTVFTAYDKTRLNSWLKHIKLMKKIDGVTDNDFKKLYKWLLSSKHRHADFWRKNILSTQKLREQYPKLQIAMLDDIKLGQSNTDRKNSKLGL